MERDSRLEHGPGWDKLTLPLIALCERHNVTIHQIKEKFGGLRFYVGDAPDAIHQAIEAAERLSIQTCENCGEPGKRGSTVRGWIRTQCEKCANQR